jgi:hypothetical protein
MRDSPKEDAKKSSVFWYIRRVSKEYGLYILKVKE